MKKVYKARDGAPFKRAEAQEIGEYIFNLKDNKGEITPLDVVNSARSKSSILNKYFDWDDTEAAKQWRLQQARNIMNHIIEVIVIDDGKNTEVKVKAYYSINAVNNKTAYVPLAVMLSNKDYKKEVLLKALNIIEDLENFLRILQNYI